LKSKRRFFLILAGALCVVIGVASVALANDSPDRATGLPVVGVTRWVGRSLADMLPERLTRVLRPAAAVPSGEMNPRLVLAYIAGKTGTPLETLHEEFRTGKTLEEIAEAYGVDWADIEEAVTGNRVRWKVVFPDGVEVEDWMNLPVIGFMSEERLEAAIQRMTENIARLEGQAEKFRRKLPDYESKIAEIEDETLREFAMRHLELLKERYELGDDHLAVMNKQLELLKDMLDYAKSR